MSADGGPPLHVAVIGGGFTGAVLILNAIRATRVALAITVVEPAAELCRGLAYGTTDPGHRINVPTHRMGLFKEDPDAATRWFQQKGILPDAASDDGQGQFYVSRQAYGAFVGDALRQMLEASRGRVTLTHLRTSATRLIRASDGRWTIALADSRTAQADAVALCFGHALPALPCDVAPAVLNHPKFVINPWDGKRLSSITPEDEVLVVGTGLTMADVVVSLLQRGHSGRITAISRRGLLPRGQGRFRIDVDFLGGAPVPRTALGLLRLLRRRLREETAQGWHPVVDALRAKLPEVWSALPPAEKGRVLRRLLPFWEVHRFRIAPQVEAILAEARRGGRLRVDTAGLEDLGLLHGRFRARLRQGKRGTESRLYDAVVLCTGPKKEPRSQPLVAALLSDALARLDDCGLGLAVDPRSRVLDASGCPSTTLFAFGPMTRGTFGEMTGAPDIAAHVERVCPCLFNDIIPLRTEVA